MKKILCLTIIVAALFTSCNTDSLSVKDYMSFIESEGNGYRISKSAGPYLIQVDYQPTEAMVINNLKKSRISKREYAECKSKFDDLDYYHIKIGVDSNADVDLAQLNAEGFADLEARLNYLSFAFEEDVKLKINNAEIEPVLFHFERNFGLTPYKTFIFAFPKTQELNSKSIVINSRILNIQNLEITYNQELNFNAPKLNLS